MRKKKKKKQTDERRKEEEGKGKALSPPLFLFSFSLHDAVRVAGFLLADGGVDVGPGVVAAAGQGDGESHLPRANTLQRCLPVSREEALAARRPSRRAAQLFARGTQ